MNNFKREEFFSLPNILSYFRIVLIPVFIWLYCSAETVKDYYICVGVVALSGFTDFLDGQIARHFGMITNVGKILDPVADKFTQATLLGCLATRYHLTILVAVILVVKEIYMACAGFQLLKRNKIISARWYGKLSTATLYIVVLILILFPSLPADLVTALLLICAAVLLLSFVSYFLLFTKILRNTKKGSEV